MGDTCYVGCLDSAAERSATAQEPRQDPSTQEERRTQVLFDADSPSEGQPSSTGQLQSTKTSEKAQKKPECDREPQQADLGEEAVNGQESKEPDDDDKPCQPYDVQSREPKEDARNPEDEERAGLLSQRHV